MPTQILLPLKGAGGEPVDLGRTIYSHGMADLPPMKAGQGGSWLEVTLALRSGRPRTVKIEPASKARARVTIAGRAPGPRTTSEVTEAVKHVLRLDEDLSSFYELAAADPHLAWVTRGAGRMVRSQSVFEEVIKTLCTTNCTWSATRRMVGALVEHLGEPAAAGDRRAFPTPQAVADAGDRFLKDTVRAGYRAPYLRAISEGVLDGSLDLEWWGRATADELPDDALADALLALPGIGPYACAHVMMMLGRYSRPIFDSWTRPTYARLVGRKNVSDAAVLRRFGRYGRYSGLAFWLFLTEGWVEA